jgi:hypothetical protein
MVWGLLLTDNWGKRKRTHKKNAYTHYGWIANPTEQNPTERWVSLSRICNPTSPSISICNALINNKTK